MNSDVLEAAPGLVLAAATTRVMTAFLSRQKMAPTDMAGAVSTVAAALGSVGRETAAAAAPAVSLKRLVLPDAVVCAECGRKGKTMTRHLRADHGLSADAYRAKWGLPYNHPLVAPDYSDQRARLARAIGLGRTSGRAARRA